MRPYLSNGEASVDIIQETISAVSRRDMALMIYAGIQTIGILGHLHPQVIDTLMQNEQIAEGYRLADAVTELVLMERDRLDEAARNN